MSKYSERKSLELMFDDVIEKLENFSMDTNTETWDQLAHAYRLYTRADRENRLSELAVLLGLASDENHVAILYELNCVALSQIVPSPSVATQVMLCAEWMGVSADEFDEYRRSSHLCRDLERLDEDLNRSSDDRRMQRR